MTTEEYKCAACGGVFAKEWTDAEAAAEYADQFGYLGPINTVTVCDDCYRLMGLPQREPAERE